MSKQDLEAVEEDSLRFCMTETAKRMHLVEHLGGRRGERCKGEVPTFLFDDTPVATIHNVPMADIQQKVASVVMH